MCDLLLLQVFVPSPSLPLFHPPSALYSPSSLSSLLPHSLPSPSSPLPPSILPFHPPSTLTFSRRVDGSGKMKDHQSEIGRQEEEEVAMEIQLSNG